MSVTNYCSFQVQPPTPLRRAYGLIHVLKKKEGFVFDKNAYQIVKSVLDNQEMLGKLTELLKTRLDPARVDYILKSGSYESVEELDRIAEQAKALTTKGEKAEKLAKRIDNILKLYPGLKDLTEARGKVAALLES